MKTRTYKAKPKSQIRRRRPQWPKLCPCCGYRSLLPVELRP